ncbi:hypothetical protein C449_00610 [Halococcus saccharolyticus DSM 5350]|uniref:Uncharacterized protein n=1 Tax=Halococcus saccharolyticus DSM 5350 TaxID=1227455 RepID=M0MRD8_9EURY|nr:hypothetical protein C449_00610 [Halococcus saccharolyticus DSM 5350]
MADNSPNEGRHEVRFVDDERDSLVADDAFVLPSGWVQAEKGRMLRYIPPHMVEELVVTDD